MCGLIELVVVAVDQGVDIVVYDAAGDEAAAAGSVEVFVV